MSADGLYSIFAAVPFLTCLWWLVTVFVDRFSGRCRASDAGSFRSFVAVSTLLYFCHFIHFTSGDVQLLAVFDGIWIFCTLSVYPLFGIWVHRLTAPVPPRQRMLGYFLAFLPGLLFSGLFFLFHSCGWDNSPVLFFVKIVFAVLVVLTLVLGLRDLRRFRRAVANYYADTDGKELKPVGTMLILLLTISVFSLTFNAIGRNVFLDSPLLVIPASIFTILLYSICYIGHQPVFDITSFQSEAEPEAEEELPAEPAQYLMDQLLEKIRRAMEEDRLYLQHGFKISDLAAAVGSNRTYISNCINRKLGITFSDFVAAYRVKEAVKRIEAAEEGANLERIGFESGFSTRSQFYRSFKKETGISPGQWPVKT